MVEDSSPVNLEATKTLPEVDSTAIVDTPAPEIEKLGKATPSRNRRERAKLRINGFIAPSQQGPQNTVLETESPFNTQPTESRSSRIRKK